MKHCLVLLLAFFATVAHAQYRGGVGKGNYTQFASMLALSAESQYAGGPNDGIHATASTLQSLAGSSPYSGGANDGSALQFAPSLALVAPSMFAGGNNDGTGSVETNAVPLLATSPYAGGANDGFGSSSVMASVLSTQSQYAGGENDGTSSILALSLLVNSPSMYAGGANDGFHSANSIAVNLLSSSAYSGGGNDGFAAASSSPISIALPLNLLYFTANRTGSDALLQWTVTGSDEILKGFGIERSFDGGDFSQIHFLQAPAGKEDFEFTDTDPAGACTNPSGCQYVYYRLKIQTNVPGNLFSPIRRITLDAPSALVSVYPNPASDKLMVDITGKEAFTISLVNSMGQTLRQTYSTGSVQVQIDVREFAAGTYFLRLASPSNTLSYQISILH